jgi:hypothetical protein
VVFGALLGLLSGALKALPGVVLPEKPRMADFTLLGVAVARVLGLPDAAFLDSFAENRTSAIERALESSVVALPLQAFMAMQPVDAEGAKVWRGMVGELFEAVRGMARDHEERFPRSSQGFGNALRRIIPALQQLGLTVNEGAHTRTGKPLTVRWVSA